ncbi:MAG: [Fe-Fe] hydrogenase large subunit C-terminal domain-containing protein, partial [Bacillota bacterium]
MESRFHSVALLEEKCKGCTNCIKRCPTEAIRVREGKAVINAARCIDCGECVRTCENHAKIIIANSLEDLRQYDYTIALPAPALYSQLERASGPDEIVWALQEIGFDEVCDVSFGADIVTECTRRHLKSFPELRPVISGACPAVVRLIQVRFPNLLPHVARVESPMYAAARVARAEASGRLGIPDERIGVFFITPCAAKVTAVLAPLGSQKSYVNGAISISDIYGDLITRMGRGGADRPMHRGSSFGFGWANSSGELKALGLNNVLAVDGIHNVLDLLEEVDDGRLAGVDYIEALACPAGCVGGPATVENPFVARARMIKISEAVEADSAQARAEAKQIVDEYGEDFFAIEGELAAVAGLAID